MRRIANSTSHISVCVHIENTRNHRPITKENQVDRERGILSMIFFGLLFDYYNIHWQHFFHYQLQKMVIMKISQVTRSTIFCYSLILVILMTVARSNPNLSAFMFNFKIMKNKPLFANIYNTRRLSLNISQ